MSKDSIKYEDEDVIMKTVMGCSTLKSTFKEKRSSQKDGWNLIPFQTLFR